MGGGVRGRSHLGALEEGSQRTEPHRCCSKVFRARDSQESRGAGLFVGRVCEQTSDSSFRVRVRKSRETIHTSLASLFSTMQDSPEYRALGQAADLLRRSINPDDIVAVLFDNHLLTEDEHDSAT